METKICTRCGKDLPMTEFYRSQKSPDGYQHYCKACKTQYYLEAKRKNNDIPRTADGRVSRDVIEAIKTNIAELRNMGWQCTVTLTFPKTIKI